MSIFDLFGARAAFYEVFFAKWNIIHKITTRSFWINYNNF